MQIEDLRKMIRSITDLSECIEDDCNEIEDMYDSDALSSIYILVDSLRYKVNELRDELRAIR